MKRRNFLAMIPIAVLGACKNPFKPESKPPPIKRYDPDKWDAHFYMHDKDEWFEYKTRKIEKPEWNT